jgi:hypothetical protein
MANESIPDNQVSGLTDLSYVVAEVLNELEDYSQNQTQRLLALGISVIRDLRIYDQASIQVAYLKVNEAGIIPFPHDYIDYVEIGVRDRGQIRPLTLDNSMLLDRGESCAQPTRKMVNTVSGGVSDIGLRFGYYLNNVFTPTYYGISGGRNSAYYKIDKAANRIQFDGIIIDGEVVLVYKSTGIGPNTTFGQEMINPIKAGIHYKRVEHNLNVPMNHKQMLKQDYDSEILKLRAFTQKFTRSEYMDIFHRYKKQTQKQ